MYENLKEYLEEIDQYLVVSEGADEILKEIESHILEKAEYHHGEVTEETIQLIIEQYGTPKSVAEKYLDGYQIISPSYKKHLFRYTGIVFAIHITIALLAAISGWRFIGFPLFIPKMGFSEFVSYIPMAFLFDFGMVALFLYFVTQGKKEVLLPLPRSLGKLGQLKVSPEQPEDEKPKVWALLALMLPLAMMLFAYYKFGTLFVASFDIKNIGWDNLESLFSPEATVFYSLLLIVIMANEIIFYGLRFIWNSPVVPLIKNSIMLIILWIAWNQPFESGMLYNPKIELLPMDLIMNVGLTIATFFTVLELVKDLYKVIKKSFIAKNTTAA